jgi:hypothetical protein
LKNVRKRFFDEFLKPAKNAKIPIFVIFESIFKKSTKSEMVTGRLVDSYKKTTLKFLIQGSGQPPLGYAILLKGLNPESNKEILWNSRIFRKSQNIFHKIHHR